MNADVVDGWRNRVLRDLRFFNHNFVITINCIITINYIIMINHIMYFLCALHFFAYSFKWCFKRVLRFGQFFNGYLSTSISIVGYKWHSQDVLKILPSTISLMPSSICFHFLKKKNNIKCKKRQRKTDFKMVVKCIYLTNNTFVK